MSEHVTIEGLTATHSRFPPTGTKLGRSGIIATPDAWGSDQDDLAQTFSLANKLDYAQPRPGPLDGVGLLGSRTRSAWACRDRGAHSGGASTMRGNSCSRGIPKRNLAHVSGLALGPHASRLQLCHLSPDQSHVSDFHSVFSLSLSLPLCPLTSLLSQHLPPRHSLPRPVQPGIQHVGTVGAQGGARARDSLWLLPLSLSLSHGLCTRPLTKFCKFSALVQLLHKSHFREYF